MRVYRALRSRRRTRIGDRPRIINNVYRESRAERKAARGGGNTNTRLMNMKWNSIRRSEVATDRPTDRADDAALSSVLQRSARLDRAQRAPGRARRRILIAVLIARIHSEGLRTPSSREREACSHIATHAFPFANSRFEASHVFRNCILRGVT